MELSLLAFAVIPIAIVFSPVVAASKPIAMALLPFELPFEPLTVARVPIAIALSAHGPILLPEPIEVPKTALFTLPLPIAIASKFDAFAFVPSATLSVYPPLAR